MIAKIIKPNVVTVILLTQLIWSPTIVIGQTLNTQPLEITTYSENNEFILKPRLNENKLKDSYLFVPNSINLKDLKLPLNKQPLEKRLDSLNRSMGGEVSGGGTSLFFNGQRRLLDVYFVPSTGRLEKESANVLHDTNKITQIDFLGGHLDSPIQQAIQRASQMSESLGHALQSIYLNTPFYSVEGRFVNLDENFYLDLKLNYPADAKISTSALNIRGVGVLISRNDFLEMDRFNQAALVVHELVRYLQIQLSVTLKNSEIQEITKALVVPSIDLKNVVKKTSLSFLIKGSQYDKIKEQFKAIAMETRSTYGLAIAPDLNRENSTLYEFANTVSAASAELLEFYIENRHNFYEAEQQHFERLSDGLDKIIVEARSAALKEDTARAWSSMAEMQGTLRKSQSTFIKECYGNGRSSEECRRLLNILDKLIK